MRIMSGVCALIITACGLSGCVQTPPAQANETAGPALQSAYCTQHPNEPRCLRR
jgi:hypothetical protein